MNRINRKSMGMRAKIISLLILALSASGSQLPADAAGPFTITVTQPSAGGSISPGNTSVADGGSQAFTLTASSGYALTSVTTNAGLLTGSALTSVVSSGIYTFTNVTAARSITASFSLIGAASTLGPLFTGAGKLYTTSPDYTGTLYSYQYSGAAVPDTVNKIMWGEIGRPLWLGAAAGDSNVNNINPFTISIDTTQPNTANCSIGATTEAGKTTISGASRRIAYAQLQGTAIGACNVIVTRTTTTNGTNSFQSANSESWIVNFGPRCDTVTTATRDSIICHVGQKGPGGGIVFYDAGSAGYASFQARYLEAAPPGWYGRNQASTFRPDWGQNVTIELGSVRPASTGDPFFPKCVGRNPNSSTPPSSRADGDAVLNSNADSVGPGVSSLLIDQSTRFGSYIGSGPNNDSLYRNSMCAYVANSPQYEIDNSNLEGAANKLWSMPSYGDMLPMIQQSYVIDLDALGGPYATNTPCWIDYSGAGAVPSTQCMNDVPRSIFSNPTTIKAIQSQQRTSPQFTRGGTLTVTPQAWNVTGLMSTTTLPQPGTGIYGSPGYHTIDYAFTAQQVRPVRAFPFYSTDADLNTTNGLSVVGGVSGTNYALTPTFAKTTTSYSLTVATGDSTVKIIPQLSDFHATVTVNGVTGGDGLASTVALTGGATLTVNVVVTAVSGDAKTYTILITRPLASQSTAVTVSNSPALVPTGGVVATTLTATGGNGTGAYSFATSTANCSISGNQLTTTLSTGSCSVTATRLADSSYAASSASTAVSFTVTAAGIVPIFDTPIKTSTGYTVNVTNYDATFTFNTAASSGAVTKGTAVGSSLPLTITGLTNGATSTVTVTTSKTNFTTQSATIAGAALYSGPTITASAPSVAVGTSVSPTISATGLQSGDQITSVTYTYAGSGGTTYTASTTKPTAIGTYSVTPSAAVFSPLPASDNYRTPTYSAGTFQITALSRTISLSSPPTSLAYNATATLSATPSIGLGTVSYSVGSSTACSISGAVITVTSGSGTCAVTATVASDGTYSSATTSSSTITITKASRTISFTSIPATLSFGTTATAVASVGAGAGAGAITYSAGSSTACSVGSSTGLITVSSGSGTCSISATIAADSNFLSVATASATSVSITRGTQAALTINSASTKGFANNYSLTSTGGTTAGVVTYAVVSTGNTANCSVVGSALTTTGIVGSSCSIIATMAGTTNYNSVTSSSFAVTIVKSAQAALTISSSTSKPFSGLHALSTTGGTGDGLISYEVTTAGTAGCSITGSAPSFSLVSTGPVGSTCGVTATSAQTTGYLAISSVQVTFTVVANAPSAPRITSVSAEDGASTISFTAPSDFGGASSIDAYTVTSSPGGITCVTTSLSCRVTGLTNGVAYTFSITARTISGGTSTASSPSSSVTAVTKASAVTGLTVTTGDTQLTLNWLAPASLGGGTFTSYAIFVKERSSSTYGAVAATITDPTVLTTILTGLTNGTPYDLKVVTLTSSDATEIVGNAAESLQTPAAPPSAPINLNAYSANGTSILINWQTPLSDGGSPISEYRVSVTSVSTSLTCVLSTLTSTSCTISSLTRGATLSISVRAFNALMGLGTAATSSYLLPNVPGLPTWGSAVASPTTGTAGTVVLNWVAPLSNGTRAITSYGVKTINATTNAVIDSQTVYAPTAIVNVSDVGMSFGYLVYAINEIGDGLWSETLTVTITLPGSVTFGAVTSSSTNVILNVSVGNNGGSPITGFLYSLDGIIYTLINSLSDQLTIPGLTGGSTYQIFVKAVNAIGQSAANSISVVLVQSLSGTGTGGGGGGFIPSGLSQSEIDAAQKIAIDKALADKAIADKILADKAAVAKAIADKLAADKLAAEKAIADKLAADKAATDKAIADKLAADKSAAAAAYRSTCNLAQGTTAVFSKSSAMKIYSQVCFVPDVMKPLSSDLAQVKKLIQELKNRKIQSITLSSFADEKSGVNFKSVAQARADVVASMVKKAIPKMKITYRLFGSSTKKNSLSLGRVVITA